MKNIKNIMIVGLGLIGGSYAQALSNKGYVVNAIDINKNSLDYALKQNWIKEGYKYIVPNALEKMDLIILGLYPKDIPQWLKENQRYLKTGALITDVGGVKTTIIEDVQAILREDLEFIAAHPMAGKEVSGAQYSDYTMFEKANFIITPTDKNSTTAIEIITELAKELNFNHITVLSPQEHDKMVAFLSQLTHVIAVTLMNTNNNTHLVEYTGDSFRDLTRIAKINEHLWTELFLLNKENLLHEITDFQAELEHFKQTLLHQDSEEMKRLFRQSTDRRKLFDKEVTKNEYTSN